MAGRTLIKTDTAGWFIDPNGDPNKKVRKSNGDQIMTREDYDALVDAGVIKTEAKAAEPEPKKETPTDRMRANAKKAEAKTTTLTSGKVVTGETVEIRCAWVDPDKRTKKQEKLFAGDPAKITYDAVVKAAGDEKAAMPDGSKRVIKKQDAFQVRFSVENQKRWRAELRRRKNKAKRDAARAAAKA